MTRDRSALERQLRCYLVTDPRAGNPERLAEICRSALRGGMTAVQLRVPGWTDREALEAARLLRDLCNEFGALFIVNDRADIALASAADGVHVGVDDLPVEAARQVLGPHAVIGYSPERDEDRRQGEAQGADYLGVGPVYGTATKDDAGPEIGLERFGEVVTASSLPVIGIGGIGPENARPVIEAGGVGVAVVSSVFLAGDPEAEARKLVEVLS